VGIQTNTPRGSFAAPSEDNHASRFCTRPLRFAPASCARGAFRAAGWGVDWRTTEGAMDKLREEVEELAGAATPEEAEEELGDVLFAAVAVARRLGSDPESALRRSTAKFAERYERALARAREEGVDLAALSEDELLAYLKTIGIPQVEEAPHQPGPNG